MPVIILTIFSVLAIVAVVAIVIYIVASVKRKSSNYEELPMSNTVVDESEDEEDEDGVYKNATDTLGKVIQGILMISTLFCGIGAVIGLFLTFSDGSNWLIFIWCLVGVVASLFAYWFVRTFSNIYLVLSEIRDNTAKKDHSEDK